MLGEGRDGGVVSRGDAELATRHHFDLLPGGVAEFAHDGLLGLDLGGKLGAA